MQDVPAILGFSEFKSLSFQDLTSVHSCVLKAMSGNLKLSSPLPEAIPSRAALVGRFHHKALELAGKAGSAVQLKSDLEASIQALQTTVDSWTHFRRGGSVSGWDEINQSVIVAKRLFDARQGRTSKGFGRPEERLQSVDGFLVGRPDYFAIVDREGVLKEFKTSSLRDESGMIRKEYHDQILFYAALLFDNFSLDRVTAILESMRGEVWERSISKDEARIYRDGAIVLLQIVNQQIQKAKSIDELQMPSAEACSYCDKTLICGTFQKKQFELSLKGDGYVIEGKLDTIKNGSFSKVAEIALKSAARSDAYEVTIPAEAASEMKLGSRYAIAGLGRERGGLRWTAHSRVFHGA
jgi:hypothetical protein